MGNSTVPKIVVGMPAYNEEKYIGSMVMLTKQYADDVIVVDDGSADRTVKIARLAGATVVQHITNTGYGSAIQDIIAEAKKKDADILVIIDADAQHNPEEIPTLIKAVSEGYDLVIGSRKMQTQSKIPLFRRVGQRVLLFFTNILSGESLSDTESGFRAYSRKAIADLKLKENGMAVSAETVSAATAAGLKVTEVPISVTYTKDGSTMNPIKHGMSVLNRILVMISERKPILFFGLLGGIFVVVGIIFGVTVVQTLYAEQILQVGSALISMLLITVGTLSIFTGLILDVLVRRLRELS